MFKLNLQCNFNYFKNITLSTPLISILIISKVFLSENTLFSNYYLLINTLFETSSLICILSSILLVGIHDIQTQVKVKVP